MALLPRKLVGGVGVGLKTVSVPVRYYYPKGWKTPQVVHEFHKVIKWQPPEELPHWAPQRTNDLYPLPKIDPNWLKLEYRPFAHIIDKLPEIQRKLFTVGYGYRKEGVAVIREELYSKIRRHEYDTRSIEMKIARATMIIRDLQDQFAKDPDVKKSGVHRHGAYLSIEFRKKQLIFLRKLDYKRFEWLIEMLGVLYKSKPPGCLIERKASLNVLVGMFCNEMRDKKMEEYKKLLEAEKIPFLEMKLDTLLHIKDDEKSIKMTCSVEEDIKSTQDLLEKLRNANLTIFPVESKSTEKQLT